MSSGIRVSTRAIKGQAPYRWMLLANLFEDSKAANEPYEPTSYKEAIEDSMQKMWVDARQEEFPSLLENHTWTLVTAPTHRKVLRGKWTFRLKRGAKGEVTRYKAHWVVRRFEQEEGFDYHETFATVVKPMSYKALFAIVSALDLEIEQLDVRTAFLYGAIDEEIFVEQPTGQEDGSNRVCLLNKALYSLKQALRIWFLIFAMFPKKLGFSPLSADLAVFARGNTFIPVYVNNMLIMRPSITEIEAIKHALGTRFNMSNLKQCHFYLGMSVRRDKPQRVLFLSQRGYIERTLRNFGMWNAKPVITPMDINKLELPEEGYTCNAPEKQWYAHAIESLMYAMLGTRVDTTFSVSIIC